MRQVLEGLKCLLQARERGLQRRLQACWGLLWPPVGSCGLLWVSVLARAELGLASAGKTRWDGPCNARDTWDVISNRIIVAMPSIALLNWLLAGCDGHDDTEAEMTENSFTLSWIF